VLFEQSILVRQGFDLAGQIPVGRALDLHLTLSARELAAQLRVLIAQMSHFLAQTYPLGRRLAAVEAGQIPPSVVREPRDGQHGAEREHNHAPAPIPGCLCVDSDARSGDTKPSPEASKPRHGSSPSISSPFVSGKPNMMFMHCTA